MHFQTTHQTSKGAVVMSFSLRPFTPPDFTQEKFQNAPNAVLVPCPKDGVAPEHYHAMSIFPEYFKVDGQWIMAKESRMDCVPVYENGVIYVREFRILKAGDLVFTGRTENCEDGIYVYPDGFQESAAQQDVFAFRQNRSRETAFSKDYDEIYDLLRHDRDHGKIVWVMGPAFAFDYDARNAFEKLVNNGYVHAMLAGNALATHDLEGAYLHTALGQNIYTTQKQLSEVSGVPASSLSEYMSGKCAPRANALQRLADALQTTPEDLCSPAKRSRWRISVKEAAACMDVPPSFIKRGLQTGALSIGSAVLCKERYRYFISPERLRAEVGPERFAQFWEGGV